MTGALPLLFLIPLALGGVLLVSAVLLFYALRKAADGSEDDTGFHHR